MQKLHFVSLLTMSAFLTITLTTDPLTLIPLDINPTILQQNKKQALLNIHYNVPSPGGIETHLLIFNKLFAQQAIPHTLLTSKHSTWIVNTINQPANPYGLHCHLYNHDEVNPTSTDILNTCKEKQISTIICNWEGPLLDASLDAAKTHPTKLIFVHHNFKEDFTDQNIEKFNQLSAIVAVSPVVTESLHRLQKSGRLQVKNIMHISPFWDEDKFLTFKPTRSKQDFFKQKFNLTFTDNDPVICSVANLYWCKNQQLLLHAAANLLHTKNKKFHLILAGEGDDLPKLEQLARELNITSCTHFVGRTLEVPELLHHIDLHVLPSSHEGFGLVQLEAAMMKKPFLAATKTAAERIIQHGITGFIFENNNAQDLANKLETLIDNPKLRQTMGQNAYNFVRQHYANKILFNKWIDLLEKI